MIIAICGFPGAGKDTVGKELARRLGYRFYSTGDMLGAVAKKRGISINELVKHAEGDESVDRDIDKFSKELGGKEDDFVISSHMAAHFIPQAFKVMLKVDMEEGARRVVQDSPNREDESYSSHEHARESMTKILETNKKRYLKLYNHNPYEGKGYDLVIDTTRITAKEVVESILKELRKAGKIRA